MQEEILLTKIRQLLADKQVEVEDFVDFLSLQDEDRRLTQVATKLSEEALRCVWDNGTDSAYDNL
jgi:hypothetical protein